MLDKLNGTWKGSINLDYCKFSMVVDLIVKSEYQKLLISSKDTGYYYFGPSEWDVDNDKLRFLLNDGENKIEFTLRLNGDKALSGRCIDNDYETDALFEKISDTPTEGEFKYKDISLDILKEFSKFSKDDDFHIPYEYKTDEIDKYRDIIDEYDLDERVHGKEDIDLMIELLGWVCDNFGHNGHSGMPNRRTARAIIDFCNRYSGKINCRGLAILLSEMCRCYGIKAKHITCIPKDQPFNECHVVVHAYSEKLNQWIMLDPTNRLYLQDENKNFLDLPTLRKKLINEEKIILNNDANYNGNFISIDNYKDYMAKNIFRFNCATNFFQGAENGLLGNTSNMLVPLNYDMSSKSYLSIKQHNRITTNEKEFWKLP